MVVEANAGFRCKAMNGLCLVNWCLLALVCLISCTSVHTQAQLGSPGRMGPVGSGLKGDIVLLSSLEDSLEVDDDDVDQCIGSAMRKAGPDLGFVKAKDFREHLYPWFMPGTTPHRIEDYLNLLGKPEVAERVAALRVRYLVVMVKSDTTTAWHGGIFCGAGYGGGGCLGLSWWDRKSDFGVAIWDLEQFSLVGKLQSKAVGTGVMPAFILPIPVYVPATESAVCREIGTRLAELLNNYKDRNR